MNGHQISRELERVLLRYRAGIISEDKAKQETAILQGMLRAREQAEMEEKVDKLTALLTESRRGR